MPGKAWYPIVVHLLSEAANSLYNNRFCESSRYRHLSYKVVVRSALTEPYLRIVVYGETEWVGRTVLPKKEPHLGYTLLTAR